MIHEAYMPVYMGSRFLARTDGRDGRDQPKVVQEVLADLKNQPAAGFGKPGGWEVDRPTHLFHIWIFIF